MHHDSKIVTSPGSEPAHCAGSAHPELAIRMRTTEAARYIGLAPSTLSRMRIRGDGPPYSKGARIVVYDCRDLEEWLCARLRLTTRSNGNGGGR